MSRRILAVAGIALGLIGPSLSHATLNKCAAAKVKCVVKTTATQLKCHAKAEKTGAAVNDPIIATCIQKAKDKFHTGGAPPVGCFATAEAKNPGACLTTDDALTLEGDASAFIDDVVTALDPNYPTAVQNACSAAKKVCVANKATALLGCHFKQLQPPGYTPETFTECAQKAMKKFDGGATPSKGCFAKLETKYAGACLTTSDTAALEAKVDAFVDATVCKLDPASDVCAAVPTPTPTPTATCPPPGATPTPNPAHACCVIPFFGCADMPPINAGDCIPAGGTVIPGGFCVCGGGCVVP